MKPGVDSGHWEDACDDQVRQEQKGIVAAHRANDRFVHLKQVIVDVVQLVYQSVPRHPGDTRLLAGDAIKAASP
jgi:hypothetical protein